MAQSPRRPRGLPKVNTRRFRAGGRSKGTGSRRRSRGPASPPARTTGSTLGDPSPSSSGPCSRFAHRSEARSSSRAGCGVPCSSTRRGLRSPGTPSCGSRTSRSSSPPRYRTHRPGARYAGSRTSRRGCGGWRCWSRRSDRRRRSSLPSRRRWGGSSSSRTREWFATRATAPPPSSRAGDSSPPTFRSGPACHWRGRAPSRWCVGPGGPRASTISRTPGVFRGLPAGLRRSFRGRHPDRRGGAALGRDDHRVAQAGANTGRYRGADAAVHRACGHGDLEH